LSTEILIASHLRLAMIVLALAQPEAVHYSRSQHHQLDTMVRGLPADNAFASDLLDLTWLEAYATAFRYREPKAALVTRLRQGN
jgi:hypothetical protein